LPTATSISVFEAISLNQPDLQEEKVGGTASSNAPELALARRSGRAIDTAFPKGQKRLVLYLKISRLNSTFTMSLNSYINKRIVVITVDGRTLLGTLLSTDQLTNLVLSQTVERIIRTPDDPEPSSEVEHGLYLIRGDNVVVCGEVDETIDSQIDWSKVKGEVIRGTKNL